MIVAVLDDLLAPLPAEPAIKRYEIALRLETGNVIYQEFADIEEAFEFLREHYNNPDAILKKISPRKKQ